MLCGQLLRPAVHVARQVIPTSACPLRTVPSLGPHKHRLPVAQVLNYQYSEAANAAPAPASAPNTGGQRIYTTYNVYKTRAALCLSVLPPTFAAKMGGKILEREGVVLLEFANVNPNTGPQQPGNTNRTYNWASKALFALDPNELGAILAGDGIASDKGLVFYHDPAKLGKTGEPIKRLTLRQMPDGAVNFALSAGNDLISLPVSKGEFEVIKTIARYAIPRLLGFDALFAP